MFYHAPQLAHDDARYGKWVRIVSGRWRYSVCLGFGGDGLDFLMTLRGGSRRWIVQDADECPRHVLRRLSRRMARKLSRMPAVVARPVECAAG